MATPEHGFHALLVEDEHDSAEIIDSLLRHYHLVATWVKTAEEAFQLLEKDHYDVVIVDLFLPGIDGLEFMRQIRSQGSTLPAVAVTAYNSSGMKKQAYEAGFNLYYPKPLDPVLLAQGLRNILA